MKRPSLQQRIVAMVEARDCATTVDDLMPELSGFTRKQVIRGLQNAHYHGHLSYDRGATKRGLGTHDGTRPGLYSPRPARLVECAGPKAQEVVTVRASSVWDYAQKVATC